ncbi:MAG: mechanosensitive ion channel, partial [Flavobacteriales bacterium]|nr:mechanosensitive ion channel [Flavobacteriales bacterium]
ALIFANQRSHEIILNFGLPRRLEIVLFPVLISMVGMLLLSNIIIWAYRRGKNKKAADALELGIQHVATLVLIGLAAVLILSVFNISVKEALTSLSLIAVAIVLITKDYISNTLNGMILTFSANLNIGDFVMIGTAKGRVIDMTLKSVQLLTDDDDVVIIPNNTVYNETLINYSKREVKKSSIEFEMDPKVYPNLKELQQVITTSFGPFESDIEADSYILKVVRADKDLLALKFQYVLKNPADKKLELDIRRHMMRSLIATLYAQPSQPTP